MPAALEPPKPFYASSESEEWYTPSAYIEAARTVMGGIDLDPASCEEANKVVNATNFYTRDDDGLSKPWIGRIWLNPPYGRQIAGFVNKLVNSYVSGSVSEAILLVPDSMDTQWAQALRYARVAFVNGRIPFYTLSGAKPAPTFGSAFFYFGPNGDKFKEVFGKFCRTYTPDV